MKALSRHLLAHAISAFILVIACAVIVFVSLDIGDEAVYNDEEYYGA